MIITEASYGDKDVLDIVKSYVKDNTINIKACNSIFGDPKPYKLKYLNMTIEGIEYSVSENQTFIFPIKGTKLKKLGIFYTNNCNPSVNYCVKDLSKFKKQGIDIITSSWSKIHGNPFVELDAINKVSSHLSIVLQVLQTLLHAKKLNKDYEYVAFLEHDVLYPDDYFEFEDFDKKALVNMNYIGLSEKGFQHKKQNDQPMHQIIMKFDNAVGHFNELLELLIQRKFKVLEPKDMQNRYCLNPSIHINNKKHFTSHYTIYSNNNTYSNHAYWGDSNKLWLKIFSKN